MSPNPSPNQLPVRPVRMSLRVGAGFLVVFGIVQAGLVFWHALPKIQSALAPQRPLPVATPQALIAPTPSAAVEESTPRPAMPAPADEALMARVRKLVGESDAAFRVGEYELALGKIQEADAIFPDDPGVLLRMGRIYERRGDTANATGVYQSVLAIPGLPVDIRAKTQRTLAMMSIPEPAPEPAVTPAEEGADMRDEFGLQPGATLGMVDTRLSDGPGTSKSLRIAIKARPDKAIDPSLVAVHVFFYDKSAEGELLPTDSPVSTEWISPPVDWTQGDPELLNATYTAPPPDSGYAYGGYVVGVYYNSELQDTRADPGPLAREHPLPLYLVNKSQ